MLDELWQEFQHETQQYKESTEERKLRFEALKKKDEESARTISRQMRKLQKLHVCVCVRVHPILKLLSQILSLTVCKIWKQQSCDGGLETMLCSHATAEFEFNTHPFIQ